MIENNNTNSDNIELLRNFFNNTHDKLLCTVNKKGEPNISIMGTPRIVDNGNIEFELSGPLSLSLENIKANKHIAFMVYMAAKRAIDYKGSRIQAEVIDIQTYGEKIEEIRDRIKKKHGEKKASELLATITCSIKNLRPIVDRGQKWDGNLDDN